MANVTEAYEHAAWRYLHAVRDDVVYGYGSPFTSTHFGRAASNLMLTVALKLKHGDRIPDELRPENHSPLGATRFEKSVKTHGPAHAAHHHLCKNITASLFPIRSTPRYHGARRRARKPQWLGM